MATARLQLARVLRRTGDATAAVALLADNARWYGSSRGGDGALLTRCLLAAADLDGDPAAAAGRLHAVLEEARAADDVEVQTLALDGLARAAAGHGDGRSAAELLLAADACPYGSSTSWTRTIGSTPSSPAT